jgi:hypothetical protein
MIPPQMFTWTGASMVPKNARAAMNMYIRGALYRLAPVNGAEQNRSAEQNRKMWAMLHDIAEQIEHCGRKYTADQWKALFLHSIGHEVQFLPSIDNGTFVPYFHSSSKLNKAEFSELLEAILAYGAEHDVKFMNDPPPAEPR